MSPAFFWMFVLCAFGFAHCVLCAGSPMHTELELGIESGPYRAKCGDYGYFKVHMEDICNDLHIELKHLKGEPNIYVSTDDQYPTYKSLAWSSYNWKHDKLVISSWDPAFKTGWYYISVHAYCGEDVMKQPQEAEFTVLVTSKHHTHPNSVDMFNSTKSATVKKEAYNYYRFCLPDQCHNVEIRLENCISQADCPKTYAYPELIISRTKEQPTINDYSWKLAEAETRSIKLDPRHEAVQPGHYYVAVYGWCTPDEYCEDPAKCAPCDYASEVAFNLSVLPTRVNSAGCPAPPGSQGSWGSSGAFGRPQGAGALVALAALGGVMVGGRW